MRRFLCACAPLALAATFGCDDAVPVESYTPPLEVVTGAPQLAGDAPAATTLASDQALTTLGASGALVLLGTEAGAYQVAAGEVTLLEIWGDEPNRPLETGRVKVVARRLDGLLLVAESGVFHTAGARLMWSPASDALAAFDIHDISATGTGETERLWIAAEQGLHELVAGSLNLWTIPGAQAPTAVLDMESLVLVAFGESIYELDLGTQTALAITHRFGQVHDIAVGPDGGAYFATDAGLVVRRADGGYVQYTLSDNDPLSVDALAFDPKEGMYAAIASGLVRARAANTPELVVPLEPPTAPRVLTSDDAGGVWLGEGTAISGWTLGTPMSFETDVKPVLESYCSVCHAPPGANDAPPIDFLDYDVAVAKSAQVAQRIGTGQMPPASATPLPADSHQIILRWIASGASP